MNPPLLVRTLALSPGGGTLVAAGEWGGALRLYDLPAGNARLVPVRLNAAVQVLCFSPDGKTLAAGCDTGDIQRWDVSRLEKN
jgi:WD40 repeat protein